MHHPSFTILHSFFLFNRSLYIRQLRGLFPLRFHIFCSFRRRRIVFQRMLIHRGLQCRLQDLWAHTAKEHHSWLKKMRKRLIFEIQQRTSVPMRPIEKRRHASNFMSDLLYSYPSRNHDADERRDECTTMQTVVCAVCAIKDWIDDFYPC